MACPSLIGWECPDLSQAVPQVRDEALLAAGKLDYSRPAASLATATQGVPTTAAVMTTAALVNELPVSWRESAACSPLVL